MNPSSLVVLRLATIVTYYQLDYLGPLVIEIPKSVEWVLLRANLILMLFMKTFVHLFLRIFKQPVGVYSTGTNHS